MDPKKAIMKQKLPAIDDPTYNDHHLNEDNAANQASQPQKKEIQVSQQTKERADAAKLFIESNNFNYSKTLFFNKCSLFLKNK